LDEPASNLHPAAQTKLLSAFAALPNNQIVVYSTHSHHMIKPEWLAGAYVVRNRGQEYEGLDLKYNAAMTDVEAEPYYQFVARHPNDTDLYRPILDALEYRPGPLEKIPDLVVVEGKNDFYTLRYLTDVIHLVDGEPLNVFPSTGKEKTESIVAQYLAWGRKFVVLLDGDRGGQQTAQRLVKTYGPLVENRIVTLADVHADWADMSMEDLFATTDRDAITATAFPGHDYEKGKFNTALTSLLIQRQEVPLKAKTTDNFRRLIQYLQAKLA
jgi:hypothetical protein